MIRRSVLLLSLAVATPAAAQTGATADAHTLWTTVRDYIATAAAEVPESMYAYRPTPEVRTFGELIAHVAGSRQMFCADALGDKPPAEDAVEKTAKTKAAILEALKESSRYCEKAYSQSDRATSATTELFGVKRTRLFILMMNTGHENEHYGNVVTYMRMNKMVPPSSKPTRS